MLRKTTIARRLWWLAAILLPLVLHADFIRLPAAQYPVSPVPAAYHTTLHLDPAAGDSFSVRVVYPEYAPLSKQEARALRESGLLPGETPICTWRQGTWRKQAVLDVTVVPFVKRQGRYWRLTSFKLDTICHPSARAARAVARTQTSGRASSSERYAAHSVLASGRWVKIRVSQEGIYQLGAEQLKAAGFSQLEKLKLYGYGGRTIDSVLTFSGSERLVDDLEEVPLYRRNGSVLFFAEGTRTLDKQADGTLKRHRNNPYSLYSYYFLTEGDAPAAWPAAVASATGATTSTDRVRAYAIVDDDAYSWYHGGRKFYEAYDYANGNAKTYRIDLPGFAAATQDERTKVVMSAAGTSGCTVNLTLNGQSAGRFTLPAVPDEYTVATERGYTLTQSPTAASNNLNIRTTAGVSARLDYICMPYWRTLSGQAAFISFSTPQEGATATTYTLSGADGGTRVWRIGRAGDPTCEMAGTLSGSSYAVALPADGRRYVTLNVQKNYPAPEIVGPIAPQDLHAHTAADMVIIIPASGKLEEQAERLADFHRQHDKLRVRVVRADLIYNEFSSGTPDATAYRRYLKMLYDRAATEADQPRFLLLFGDCVWDNRGVTDEWRGASLDDYLLAYESEYALGSLRGYVTDDYFGLLDDGEGASIEREKVDLAIGRFTATTVEEARTLVDKAMAYAQNTETGNWKNRIEMMADDGDGNLHMRDAEAVISDVQTLTRDFVIDKTYWDAYNREATAAGVSYPQVRTQLRNAIDKSALIFNYTGHGSPAQVSHEKVLLTKDFNNTNTKWPLWILASCEVDPYDDPADWNIGRTAVLNPKGGAIAFICASRTVYSDKNNNLNRLLMRQLLTLRNGQCPTLGEALMNTKVQLVSNSSLADRTYNRLKYVLIGDPALRLNYPTAKVVIDSINGVSPDRQTIQLKAGQVVSVSGHIATPDGQRNDDFEGTVSGTLFDIENTITCKNNDGSATTNYTFKAWESILFDGTDSVRNGTFRLHIPVPYDISYSNASGRLVLYAADAKRKQEANGSTTRIFLNGTADDVATDSLGPKINLYLNHPDFANGGTVAANAVFYANIEDADGINATGNGVGHDIELSIDNDETTTFVLNDYFAFDFGSYTKGSVSYPLNNLPIGRHRLTLRAWDLRNTPSTASLEFTVSAEQRPTLQTYATENPARTTTTFNISTNQATSDAPYTVSVYNLNGRRVWMGRGQLNGMGYAALRWDLHTDSGAPLSSGLYVYRTEMTVGKEKIQSSPQKIVVAKQ